MKLKTTLHTLLLSLTSILFSFATFSQCGPLSTPSYTNNGQSGIMFDIVAITSVEITQFGMDYDNGTYDIEIYTIPGTHVGNETNAGAWTLLGTVNGWTGISGTNNTIPITFSEMLCPGEVQGFYVTASNSTGGNYSNGTGVGNVAASDANIQILEGTGKAYPFSTSFTPRVPNVTVFYNCLMSCCTPPTMSMTQETCVGSCDGTATATVGAGGVPPFTYQWDAAAGNQTTQTATGLCAGTYTVNITDGTGCVASGTIIVTSGAASANATITPAGPYCELDAPVTLSAVDPGGTWSGTGITDAVNGIFDPGVAGPGTHTITYTISGPCGDSQTTDITVTAQLDATITPVGTVCALDAPFNLSAVDPGGTWSGTGITDAVNGTFDPGSAGPGTHTITYTIPGTCGDVQTTDIVVDPQILATITPAGPYCTAEPPVNLSSMNPGGTWSGTGITDPVNGTFDPATAGVGTHTITYTIPGACGDVQTMDIVVNSTLDATITPAGPFCTAEPAINLTAVDGGGTWSGNGITDPNNGTFDPATAGVGTHTITYTIPGVCGDVQTTDITITPTADATITQVGPYCETEPSVTLSAVDPGGTWSGTGITDPANGIFDPATAGIGTHTITYTIPGTCGDVQSIDIVINSTFDATITPAGPYCDSDPAVNMTAVDAGGTWSGTGITDPANGTFDPAVAGAGTHTITYTIAGSCGDVQTTSITVDPSMDATITPAGPYCDTDPAVNMTAVDPGGTWSGTGITDPVNGTFDPAVAGAGTHTITYTISGMCGDTQTTDVVVNTTSNATITPAGPFCVSDPAMNMTAVDPGGTWSGTGITDPTYGTFDPAVAGVGIHTITYTISGSCGDTQTYDVEVHSLDDATITPVGPLCLGSTATLTAVTSGGTWSGTGITDPVAGTFDASVAGPGTHTITYTTSGFCPDQSTTDITVLDPLSLQAFGDTTICDGATVPLSATGSGGDGNYTFVWTDGGGNTVASTANTTVSPSITTTYTVTISDGCGTPIKMANVTVIVNPIPVVNFVANQLTGCLPFDVTFTNTSVPGGTDCSWNFGNGLTSNSCGSATVTYTDGGCYDVTLTVTENGCTNSTTIQDYICATNEPVANFVASPEETTIFDTQIEFTNLSSNATVYQWDFDNEGETSIEEDPIYTYPGEPGAYTVCLIASNDYGCKDTICKDITIVEDVIFYIPNTFTPDGDEFNQALGAVFATGIDPYDFNFAIFNRWGEIIWETNDPSVGWDGSFNGANDLVESGTYVWRLEFKVRKNDERQIYYGHVNVLR